MNLKNGSIATPYTYFLWPSRVCNLTNLLSFWILHTIEVPSREHETKWVESLDQERPITSPTWPLIYLGCPHWTVSSILPNSIGTERRVQTATIWSSEPLARNCPLGENLTMFTVLEWPPCRSYKCWGSYLLNTVGSSFCLVSLDYTVDFFGFWSFQNLMPESYSLLVLAVTK
jgi:hypothetical protein